MPGYALHALQTSAFVRHAAGLPQGARLREKVDAAQRASTDGVWWGWPIAVHVVADELAAAWWTEVPSAWVLQRFFAAPTIECIDEVS